VLLLKQNKREVQLGKAASEEMHLEVTVEDKHQQ